MKVMLAIAPWDLWIGDEEGIYPLGLAYLAAVLEKNNHQVSLLNLSHSKWENVKESVVDKIKKENPDIFGVSILSNSRISALKLLNEVKKINPNIKIIAGGVHTTCLYEQVINNYPIDFAVLGEGEYTMIELVDAIKKKKPINYFKKIKGIAFKNNGEIIKTEPRERIQNLDALPIPKHELFKEEIDRIKKVYIMSSRGCPFSCAFCPSSVHWGRCRTQRSEENIFEEIKYVLKKFPNIESLHFNDDEFICDNKRVIELCKRIMDNGIKIKWSCVGRVSSINEELLKAMKESGCTQIAFGIETGSQRVLDNIGKKVKVNQIIDAFKLCKKYRIATSFLTIVGLPGENRESVNETIKLAKEVKASTEPAILIIYPGTEVYKLAKEKGLMTDDYWLQGGLPPLYTCEHSKLRLGLWAFKIGLITNFYSEDSSAFVFLKKKVLNKFTPFAVNRLFKRYVSDKT